MNAKTRIARLENQLEQRQEGEVVTRVILPSADPKFACAILDGNSARHLTQAEYDALPRGQVRVIVPPNDHGETVHH